MALPARQLGRSGPAVSAVGFGAMSLAGVYGPADDAESVKTVRRALDLGVTLLDTADIYGDGRSERLVGEAIQGRRGEGNVAPQIRGRGHPGRPGGALGAPRGGGAAPPRSAAR